MMTNSQNVSRPTLSNSKYIKQLQQYLRALSYEYTDIPQIIPSGIMGDETKDALKVFQKIAGIAPTGEPDSQTMGELENYYMKCSFTEGGPCSFDSYPSRDISFKSGEFNPCIFSVQYAFSTLCEHYSNFHKPEYTGTIDEVTYQNLHELRRIAQLPEGPCLDKKLWDILTQIHNSLISFQKVTK